MTTDARKAKVTKVHKEEAERLFHLWKSHSPRLVQGEFGETYEIGNQSAVSQFLRGKVPLSLNAARGFARGLGCSIDEFSPRLASEAAAGADLVTSEAAPGWPFTTIRRGEIESLDRRQLARLEKTMRDRINELLEDAADAGNDEEPSIAPPNRIRGSR